MFQGLIKKWNNKVSSRKGGRNIFALSKEKKNVYLF